MVNQGKCLLFYDFFSLNVNKNCTVSFLFAHLDLLKKIYDNYKLYSLGLGYNYMHEVKRHANLINLYADLHENFRCLTKLFTKRGNG